MSKEETKQFYEDLELTGYADILVAYRDDKISCQDGVLLSKYHASINTHTDSFSVLKEIYNLTDGPWDDPVISDVLYAKMVIAIKS